jgi:hypothetical protein
VGFILIVLAGWLIVEAVNAVWRFRQKKMYVQSLDVFPEEK